MIPIGLCYLLFIPLGKVPDEETHAKRAYEISEGQLITGRNKQNRSGRMLNKNMVTYFRYKSYHDYKKVFTKKDKKEKSFSAFPAASVYSFLCYIPQSTGILLGRILNLPLIFQLYLGRIFSFISWLILIYFAIKIIPYKKICVFGICFLPMMIQQAISLSADSLTNGISIFFIAYTLYLKERKESLSKKDFVILSITTVILSMCKIVYLPICLIVFIIPYSKFSSKKDKYIKLGLLILSVIILNLIWLKIGSSYLQQSNMRTNPSTQLQFILSSPITYLQYCFNTIYEYGFSWIFTLVGSSLCLNDVNLSQTYSIILVFLIVYLLLFDNNKKIDNYSKLLSFFIIGSIVMLILTSLFMQWTTVGSTKIEGIQGRYFIPLLLPLSILMNNTNISIKKGIRINLITYLLIFINIYALMSIFFAHLS